MTHPCFTSTGFYRWDYAKIRIKASDILESFYISNISQETKHKKWGYTFNRYAELDLLFKEPTHF